MQREKERETERDGDGVRLGVKSKSFPCLRLYIYI